MKSKIIIILAAVLMLSSFSACDKTAPSFDDNHSVVNYTDTVENASRNNSRTKEIEHSVVSSEITEQSTRASSSDADVDQKNVSTNDDSSDISSKNTSSIASNTVETTIYYYENDDNDDDSQTPTSDTDTDISSDMDSDSVISDDTDVTSQTVSEQPVIIGSFSEDDIAFFYNREKIYLGDDINAATAIAGEPNSVDYHNYNYNDFWIAVTQNEDSMFVEEIQIFNNTLETEKGIKVGMTEDDVIKAYGESSIVINDEHRYYVGNKYMYFDVQNGIVADIGYRIDREVDNESE